MDPKRQALELLLKKLKDQDLDRMQNKHVDPKMLEQMDSEMHPVQSADQQSDVPNTNHAIETDVSDPSPQMPEPNGDNEVEPDFQSPDGEEDPSSDENVDVELARMQKKKALMAMQKA